MALSRTDVQLKVNWVARWKSLVRRRRASSAVRGGRERGREGEREDKVIIILSSTRLAMSCMCTIRSPLHSSVKSGTLLTAAMATKWSCDSRQDTKAGTSSSTELEEDKDRNNYSLL